MLNLTPYQEILFTQMTKVVKTDDQDTLVALWKLIHRDYQPDYSEMTTSEWKRTILWAFEDLTDQLAANGSR